MDNEKMQEWPVIVPVTEEQSLNIEAYRYKLDAYEVMVRQCTGNSNPDAPVMCAENFKILVDAYQAAFVEFNVAFSELARLAAPEYPMSEYMVQLNFGNNSLMVFPRGYQG